MLRKINTHWCIYQPKVDCCKESFWRTGWIMIQKGSQCTNLPMSAPVDVKNPRMRYFPIRPSLLTKDKQGDPSLSKVSSCHSDTPLGSSQWILIEMESGVSTNWKQKHSWSSRIQGCCRLFLACFGVMNCRNGTSTAEWRYKKTIMLVCLYEILQDMSTDQLNIRSLAAISWS